MKKDRLADEELDDDKAGTLYGETQVLEEDPCDYEETQLYGETQALDDHDPLGPGFTEVLDDPVDAAIETQLVEDVNDWVETQVVEYEEEEKDGFEQSEGAQNCEVRECVVDSDASTDDEGCGSGIIQRRLTSVRVASVRSSALAASRNFATKSDTSTGNNSALKCQNVLSKCTTPYGTLVREKNGFGIDSEQNQAKNKTARQLFADTSLEMDRSSSVSAERIHKDSAYVLSYVESQEPGIMSQESALEVVDKLIALHDVSLTTEEGKTVEEFNDHEIGDRLVHSVQNGTIQLAKNMCPANLAKKANIFDWDDVKEDETGGDFFAKKKKDLLYDIRKKTQSHPLKGKQRKASDLGRSDSRLVLHPRDEIACINIRKNLFSERDNEGQRLDVGNDNVGPDTQIAVEAIQALVDDLPCKPGLYKGKEIVEIGREGIINDGISGRVDSTISAEETINNKAMRRGREKSMPNEHKPINCAKKRKVATGNESIFVPEKFESDSAKTGLDILFNSTPIPRKPRSLRGSEHGNNAATPIKGLGQNGAFRQKRVFIRSATELLVKAKKQRLASVSSLYKQKIDKVSPVFTPKKSQRKALDGGSYRPSVQRELLRLDNNNMGESSVVRKWKDLRIRRDLADARVLLSNHLGEKVIRQQRKILERLGIPEASNMSDGTHFVANEFIRTKNLLEAMARGKPIVTTAWLERCNLSNQFVDEKGFILRDGRKEKEICFSMPHSLATACHIPLLKGKRVLITPGVKPSLEIVRNLITACGGTPTERIVSSLTKGKLRDDILLVSCEEDYQTCRPLLEKGVDAYNSELILNGIVIQKLELKRHRLFSDSVKRTRSSIWLRDEGGKFFPTKCA